MNLPPRWIVVFGLFATLLVFVITILLVYPGLLPENLQDASVRIGLAQLCVEFVSLFALLLAIREFSQAQRRPKLKLWIMPFKNDQPFGELSQASAVKYEHSSTPGIGRVYGFQFKLYLENYGSAAARWLKISIMLDDNRPPIDLLVSTTHIRRQTKELVSGNWAPPSQMETTWLTFHGGDDFIVYDRPKRVKLSHQWLDDLGKFRLFVPVAEVEEETGVEIKLICSVQADGFVDHNQILTFCSNDLSRIGSG